MSEFSLYLFSILFVPYLLSFLFISLLLVCFCLFLDFLHSHSIIYLFLFISLSLRLVCSFLTFRFHFSIIFLFSPFLLRFSIICCFFSLTCFSLTFSFPFFCINSEGFWRFCIAFWISKRDVRCLYYFNLPDFCCAVVEFISL